MTLPELIKACQRSVGARDDGLAGPETWGLLYERLHGKPAVDRVTIPAGPSFATGPDTTSPRSEEMIVTLLPEVQPYARALWHLARNHGLHLEILEATRSYARQEEIYAEGRTRPGKIRTHAHGGYSNHNFGLAFDVGLFDGKNYLEEGPDYRAVGILGEGIGLEWGGRWKSIQDEPHFELRPLWARGMEEKAILAELRARKAGNRPVFT